MCTCVWTVYVCVLCVLCVLCVCVCVYMCVDTCRLKAVKTTEELSDVYAHFKLYYGRDLVEMQHRKSAQQREGEEDQVSCTLSI